MKECSKLLMEKLISEYNRTKINSFDFDSYIDVENHDEAIEELKSKGMIEIKDNINATIFISDQLLNK